ncbi:hypothetical protein MY4824_007259 [Beauveria thailandica]
MKQMIKRINRDQNAPGGDAGLSSAGEQSQRTRGFPSASTGISTDDHGETRRFTILPTRDLFAFCPRRFFGFRLEPGLKLDIDCVLPGERLSLSCINHFAFEADDHWPRRDDISEIAFAFHEITTQKASTPIFYLIDYRLCRQKRPTADRPTTTVFQAVGGRFFDAEDDGSWGYNDVDSSYWYLESIFDFVILLRRMAVNRARYVDELWEKISEKSFRILAYEPDEKGGTFARASEERVQGKVTSSHSGVYLPPPLGLKLIHRHTEHIKEASDKIQDEITILSQEVSSLLAVNESIEDFFHSRHDLGSFDESLEEGSPANKLWKNLAQLLQQSRVIIEQLEALLNEVVGKKGHQVTGKIDSLRKTPGYDSGRAPARAALRRPWPLSWLMPLPKFGAFEATEYAKFSLVYLQCGEYAKAEELQLRAKDYLFSKVGPVSEYGIEMALLLSRNYVLQTRNNEARHLQHEVLKSAQQYYGMNHPKTLQVMDNLGATCLLCSRLSEAQRLHEEVIQRTAVANLFKVKLRYFDNAAAIRLQRQAYMGFERILGPTHQKTLEAKDNLAGIYGFAGVHQLSLAQQMSDEVLQVRIRDLGREHPLTLKSMLTLAKIKTALNQFEEAEAIFLEGLPAAERNLGKSHLGTLTARIWLAHLYWRQGRYSEAADIWEHVIEKRNFQQSKREDGEHGDRAQAMWFLFHCYEDQGRIVKALELCEQLHELLRGFGGDTLAQQHKLWKRHQAEAAPREQVTLAILPHVQVASPCRSHPGAVLRCKSTSTSETCRFQKFLCKQTWSAFSAWTCAKTHEPIMPISTLEMVGPSPPSLECSCMGGGKLTTGELDTSELG